MIERMPGYDTSFFHFADHSPMHTLKCLVLDTSHRGRAVAFEEFRLAIGSRLGLHPRGRQRAMRSSALPGCYDWVDDPGFDLDAHLAEATLDRPDDFDGLCGALATTPLPDDRPLWHATLVHGLGPDRQAVVFQIHHAVMDGIGAANSFRFFTTESPGTSVPAAPVATWSPAPLPSERGLRSRALRATPAYGRNLITFARETRATRADRRADAQEIRRRDDLIGLRSEATYGWTGARFGGTRSCAHGSLPLDTFRAIKDRHGVTLNDVLVAVVGEAIAAEARRRGETPRPKDEIAMFSIALNTDPTRLAGNAIMAISVPMHTRGDDLAERLAAIKRTNQDQIRLTRRQQDRRSVRITDLWARSFALGARVFAYRIPTMVANVVMANVAASPEPRWLGDVAVADFISYAVLVQPIGVNITVYSYDGHMSFGVLTAPEVIDDASRIVRHLEDALARFDAVAPAAP